MCAVIGAFGEVSVEFRATLLVLWNESRIRGLHAAGFWCDGELCRHPDWKRATAKLDALLEEASGPVSVIAHLRYSTSGDYTLPQNNQPVAVRDRVLVFNGVLDQRSKSERQQDFAEELETDNDGEHFLIALDRGEAPEDWIGRQTGSFAGLYEEQGSVYALRNARRPLWRAETGFGTFVASTKDIALRAAPAAQIEEFEPCKVYRVA